MQVLKYFKDELTGDQCAIISQNGQEVCILAEDVWEANATYTS